MEEDNITIHAYLLEENINEIYSLLDKLTDGNREFDYISDRVRHPSHYSYPNGLEIWDIARYHDFDTGNAMKYLSRCGRKEEVGMSLKEKEIEDLKKSLEYIHDKIKMVENETKEL